MTAPEINVWYRLHQTFGRVGNPQRWINILGNVSGGAGGVASLTYTLNGVPGSPSLSIGPDSRRLLSHGDFNVELDRDLLTIGQNTLIITATDGAGSHVSKRVTIEYCGGNVWPLPYSVDWRTVTNMHEAVQVVDGLWALGSEGIRPVLVGYDRVVAFGDETWEDDCEVTVAITAHAIDPAAYNPISVSPGMGIVTKWSGHTDYPVAWPQPHAGWLPAGATGWYDWGMDGGVLYFRREDGSFVDKDGGVKLEFEVRYTWKMRVESMRGEGYRYRLKVWRDDGPEPPGWNLDGMYGIDTPARGSFLFVAHHVDATLGNLTVVPLA